MPFADRGPASLYYESRGRGPAVLLVMGLGMTLAAWWRTVPVLAASFRVLTFDNRGVGRSEPAALPYTVAQMADDAIAVLDAAGEDAAHVYGISLGGMVAQEAALRHPERVRALVLGATTPGGSRATAPDAAAGGSAFWRFGAGQLVTSGHRLDADRGLRLKRPASLVGGRAGVPSDAPHGCRLVGVAGAAREPRLVRRGSEGPQATCCLRRAPGHGRRRARREDRAGLRRPRRPAHRARRRCPGPGAAPGGRTRAFATPRRSDECVCRRRKPAMTRSARGSSVG